MLQFCKVWQSKLSNSSSGVGLGSARADHELLQNWTNSSNCSMVLECMPDVKLTLVIATAACRLLQMLPVRPGSSSKSVTVLAM